MFGVNTLYRRVFWPDTHCPNQDTAAVSVARQIVKQFKPHEFIFLGDFQDCASVSEHSKTPEVEWQGLRQELKPGIELMHSIVKESKANSVVYLMGNHESRIKKYCDKYATKLHGLLDPVNILGIPKGWILVNYGGTNAFYKCGNSDLIAVHGSLLGPTPARSNTQKYKTSVICGHTHKLQSFYSTDVHGKTIVGMSAGHLSNVSENAGYVDSVADWQHAILLGSFKKSGSFFLEPIEIKAGEAVFRGDLTQA